MHNRFSNMTENKQRNSWMNPRMSQRLSSQSASFVANGFRTNKRLVRRLLITGRPWSEWNDRLMARLLTEQKRSQRPLRTHAETNPSTSSEHTASLTLLCFTSAAHPPCPQLSRHRRRRHHLLKKKKRKVKGSVYSVNCRINEENPDRSDVFYCWKYC